MNTSPLVASILQQILDELHRQELIELSPGVDTAALREDVAGRLQGQRDFEQFSGWFSRALLRSPLVEELYASDEQLLQIFRDIQP